MSRRLDWLRPLAVGMATALLCAAFYLLIQPDAQRLDELFIPTLLAFCWSTLLYCFLALFRDVPKSAGGEMRLLHRYRRAVHRGLLYIVALAFGVLSLSLLVISFKLLATGVGNLPIM